MNNQLLNSEVQRFITENQFLEPAEISLKKSPFPEVSPAELAQQIAGRRKARTKLPTWYHGTGIIYPPSLGMEQCSSEATALYKAKLTRGKTLIDITGGFGVDSYFFSLKNETVHYCELQPELAQLAAHNFTVLGTTNIQVHPESGLQMVQKLASEGIRFDWIYADPSRRATGGGKVVDLRDYTPNIPDHLSDLLPLTSNLLVKTSPMLDLSAGSLALPGVREIHCVCVHNEVRELLWWIQPNYNGPITRIAVELNHELPFQFTFEEEQRVFARYEPPGLYLYEPHAGLMKTGPFGLIGDRFNLAKLHRHTHLYTSNSLIPFPGRRFRILETLPYKAKKLPFTKANIATRNFPDSVDKIRQRTRIKSGGNTYLFFVKLWDDSLKVLVTEAIS